MAKAGADPLNVGMWLGQASLDAETGNPVRDIETLRNFVWAWSFPLGALGLVLTLVNSLRRTRLMEADARIKRDELNARTFTDAVKLLAAEEKQTRLGGIYALESLMRADFADADAKRSDGHLGRQAGETLAAFVRARAPNDPPDELPSDALLPDELQAAVTVLVRSWPYPWRPELERERGVDLSACRLRGLILPDSADLRRFNLNDTNLDRAILIGLNGKGAWFQRCSLKQANLSHANLDAAWLSYAQLTRALLPGAELNGALLSRANMDYAEIEDAKLKGAVLHYASLREVDLEYADLRSASCYRAKFVEAAMKGALFLGTKLDRADLSNATILDGEVDDGKLTSEQLAQARWDPDHPPSVPDRLLPLPHDGRGSRTASSAGQS